MIDAKAHDTMAAKKQVGKYEIGRTFGEGTFGKVKHAVHVSSVESKSPSRS